MPPHVDPDPAQLGRLAATLRKGALQIFDRTRFRAHARVWQIPMQQGDDAGGVA